MFDTGYLRSVLAAVQAIQEATDDTDRIDRITLIEQLKSALSAVQAAETAAFVASKRAEHAAAGRKNDEIGRGIAHSIALARRISPHRASRYVGLAVTMSEELPGTFAALRAGRTSEWRAMVVARETLFLSREHRAVADQQLAPQLEGWGDRQVEAESRRVAYRLDPAGFIKRTRGAERDRRVTLRPAPDTMARLTAFLPVAQGVAVHTALSRHADSLIATGDGRGRGQIMSDTLVERVTGQAAADSVDVEVNVLITDAALLGGAVPAVGSGAAEVALDEPAILVGYGPIPAASARELIFGANAGQTWIRRIFRDPDTGQLAAMDSRRRLFSPSQRHLLTLRDQICRTPWCDAPIRHIDHVVPWENGGETTPDNGQGYCAACNYAKQAPGWATKQTDQAGEIEIRTPTGHSHRHTPPDPPGSRYRSG